MPKNLIPPARPHTVSYFLHYDVMSPFCFSPSLYLLFLLLWGRCKSTIPVSSVILILLSLLCVCVCVCVYSYVCVPLRALFSHAGIIGLVHTFSQYVCTPCPFKFSRSLSPISPQHQMATRRKAHCWIAVWVVVTVTIIVPRVATTRGTALDILVNSSFFFSLAWCLIIFFTHLKT